MTNHIDRTFRILFVCSARSWGGNEKWSVMAMNALATRGHTVVLLARNKTIWSGRLHNVSIRSMPFFFHLNPLTYLASFILLGHFKIDRIISTKRAEYVVMGILSRIMGIRHLIRLGIVREINSRYRAWVYGRLNDGIVVNASRTRNVLLTHTAFKPENVKLIYNGIPDPPEALEISFPEEESEIFRIISVGALHPRKGFDKLIEGISLLKPEHLKRIELVIVGEGPASEVLKSLVKVKGLENQVIFKGFLNNPGDELIKAHLFALITENEGISNALLEAMALGIPALTTAAGGTEDFMIDNDNGFFVNPSPDAVSRRLEEIITNIRLKDVGLRGRDTVLDFFSLDRMTRELEAFIAGEQS